MGRLTALDLPGSAEDVSFTYDSCSNGVGRLCQITDQSGGTGYSYDSFGNVTQQSKTELSQTYTTSYLYDAADRVTSMTYPDGRTVTYTRDAIGRTTQINVTVNGTNTTITSNIQYRADGLLSGQTWGNGLNESRSYDQQGRLESQTTGTLDSRTYTYDDNGNILTKTRGTATDTYIYDELDRLRTDNTSVGNITYEYDQVGNRLKQLIGELSEDYTYDPNTNRLLTKGATNVVTDPAGNITNNGTYTFTYNNAGRLYQVLQGTTTVATYTYNVLGQRTRKVISSGTTIYHYDLFGSLIAETSEIATSQKAYVWHNGSPVAQITGGGTESLVRLHTDHLATARFATNNTGQIVWSWEGDAFGATLANEDVDGDLLGVVVNVRFPGQYFDQETQLHYNYFRYYDPQLGRYITSDPIGLLAGLNTYSYVGERPLIFIDPLGLEPYSQEFWDAYLNYDIYSGSDVWSAIGGSLNKTYGPYSNSCAARISYGLNYGGEPIPSGVAGGNRNYTGDNKRYVISARMLRKYLNKTWGGPTTTLSSGKDLISLKKSLVDGQVAIVVSQGHAAVVTKGYSDPYVDAFLGDAWVLPVKPKPVKGEKTEDCCD